LQPLIFQQVIDRGIGERDSTFLIVASVLLLVVNVSVSVLGFGMTFLKEYVSQRVSYDLRNALYDHLQHLSFAYHDRSKTGELMSRVTSDVDSARVFTGQGLLQIVNTVVLYVSILVLMFSLHWRLALLGLVTMPVLAYTAVNYGTRVRPMYSRMQRQWAQLTAVLQENITGVRVVKAFARESYEVDKFSSENREYLQRNIAATRLQALVYPLMLFISSIGTVIILWYGGREVVVGNLTVGTLVAFNSFLMRLASPTRMLGYIIGWVSRATASGERLFEILDTPSPVAERPNARSLEAVEGRLTFDHVYFTYGAGRDGEGPSWRPAAERLTDTGFARPNVAAGARTDVSAGQRSSGMGDGRAASAAAGAARPLASGANGASNGGDSQQSWVLEDIAFDAAPDEVVALVGHTGAGKSTLISLIPRFYDVAQGAVRVDGHDVRDVQLQSLRRHIGIVLQESLLFSATVAENIAYGRPDAPLEAIERAARAAQAYDFVRELPDGFDTEIGERGVTLSGGQRQRLAIARALLIDPRILILDDATASVDMRTEFLIQQALQTLMRGRTTIVIAQRLTTIKQADQILVMDHGRIAQRGTHDQLVAVEGPYRGIYDLQLRQQEELQHQMATATAHAVHES
jgi:ATP-binding cassette subfamily B protein